MAYRLNEQTGQLARFIVKRDRLRLLLWLVGITFFTLIVPIALKELYGSQAERETMAHTLNNPAMIAMFGPADLQHYTLGVMTAHQMLLLTAVVVGIMNIMLISRHTRADEEEGRIEMIRSLPVGRHAHLNAIFLVYSIANFLLAFMIGIGLYALNIESMDLNGSFLYGVTLGVTGIFFMGVTALFAQFAESSRSTIGFSIAILLVVYLVRGIGDVSNEALSWLSPFGWVTKTQIYADNNWWPMVLMLSLTIIFIAVAKYLNAIRDLGAGFLPAKPGKKFASIYLLSPTGLGLRLQRTGLSAWAIGMFVIGVSYGSVFGDLDSFFAGNETMLQLLAASEGQSITEQFLPMLMLVMAIMATIPPVMVMNKLYTEEKKGRIEHLLGRAVSRVQLMGSFLLIAIICGFVMISLEAIGIWTASVFVMEEPFTFATLYGTAIAYYPAIVVMISVMVCLIGWIPKWTNFIWLYVFYSFIVLYLGGLFQFPDWVGLFSPFDYIPQLPVEEMSWLPILVLTTIAVLIIIVGFIGFNRRDIEA